MELTEKNIKNFWKKVDIKSEDECWEWTGCKNNDDYGQININKKTYRSHRISWILHYDDIPKDNSIYGTMLVLHKCDNPGCVNPNHLFLGTNKDNMEDMVTKNRNKIPDNSGEKHGRHKLTEREVLEIRFKYSSCLYLQKDLAEEYGIKQISLIVNNKIWKHI